MSVAQLEQAAAALGDLGDRVVLLGGAIVGLWRTDEAARAPRVTLDVDVIARGLDARQVRALPSRSSGPRQTLRCPEPTVQ